MKEIAKKRGLLIQHRRMLLASWFLENAKITTPFVLIYLELTLACKNTNRFVQLTPMKCLSNFVQSAVNDGREGDEDPKYIIVTERMNLLTDSSDGWHIMDWSRHTVTEDLTDEKTHGVIDNKLFRRLRYVSDQLYEVELVKSENEHKEPIIVRFFHMQ